MEASSAIQPGMPWRDVRIWAQLLIAMRNLHLYQVVVCLLKLLSHELSPECLSQNNHLCCPPCRERGTFRSFFQWVKVSSCKAFNMYVLRQAFKPCYHRTHVNAVTTRLWDVFRRISHVEDDVLCTKKKKSVWRKSSGMQKVQVQFLLQWLLPVQTPFYPFYNCTAGCKHLQGGQFMPFVFFGFF